MAIAWMVNTGIYQKMEKDVTTSQALRPHFEEAFWTPDSSRTSTVLSMNHLLVPFLMLLVLLVVSVVIFLCELALKKKNANPCKAHLADLLDCVRPLCLPDYQNMTFALSLHMYPTFFPVVNAMNFIAF